jgi:hypothetical protein
MNTSNAIAPVQAPKDVWLELQRLLGEQYELWVDKLPNLLREGKASYIYLRKRRDQMFWLPIGDSGHDAIISVDLPTRADQIQVIVIEQVLPHSQNSLAKLTPGENALLEFISPYLRG